MGIELLDTVALTVDLPDHGLLRGQVGTIIEVLDEAAYVFEVEFCDSRGVTYATLTLSGDQLMVLHYEPDKIK